MQLTTQKKILLGVVIIAVLGVSWWLASPLFIDKQISEPLPSSSVTSAEMTGGEMKEETSTDGMEDGQMKEEMSVLHFSGNFVDADSSHSTSGDVFTVKTDDGIYLRFENFEATNGPDLYVYLAKSGGKTSEGIRLEKLKGNVGDQNYLLPAGVDLTEYDKVVIWCKAFDVDFGYAELSKA